MASRIMSLRYAGRCCACGAELPRGERALWNAEKKAVTCLICLEHGLVEAEATIDHGRAGGSAAREWHRRHDRREANLRARYGKLSGVVSAFTDDPQSTTAWARGANGESALGKQLDLLRDEGIAVLHDRRIPGSKANIDHIVIGPAGVFVVDAKNYKGRVERRDRGGLFSIDYRLFVGGRDKTKLIGGMDRQIEATRAALGAYTAHVTPVVCFVDSDWSLFARPLMFGDVHIVWPRALGKLLRSDGPLPVNTIALIERQLALALPAAA